MIFDINEKDMEVVEVFLKKKGLSYVSYENEHKLLIHKEVLLRLNCEEEDHPIKVKQLESNIGCIVDTLYTENSNYLDENIESIASRFIAHELYK